MHFHMSLRVKRGWEKRDAFVLSETLYEGEMMMI